jgi:hypothetical protein
MLERLRSLFFENGSLKLLSVAVALVLYSLVHGGQDAQRTISVDLVLLLPPETQNRVLVSTVPPQVRITLRGNRTAIDDLRAEDVGSLQIDVRAGQDRRVVLEPSMVRVPPGLRLEHFDPPVVDFAWEDQIVRDVPVQVGVVGTPAPGYVVRGTPSPEPPTVRARGPQSEILVLQHARADAFDVTGLGEGHHTRVLAIDRPSGRSSYETRNVTVTVEIAREVAERSFTKIPVAVVGVPKGKALPGEVDVRLVCPPDVVHALRAEQLVPEARVATGAASGSESLPVHLAVTHCEVHVTPDHVVVRW